MINFGNQVNKLLLYKKLTSIKSLNIQEIEKMFSTRFCYEDTKYVIQSYVYLKNQQIPLCSGKNSSSVSDKKA